VTRRGLQWTAPGVGLSILVVWTNPTTLVAVVVLVVTLAVIGLVGLLAGRIQWPRRELTG
jgi:hypothetical protein